MSDNIFSMFFQVNPFIVSSPPSELQVQHVGDSVSLRCSAGGSPLPKVKWFKDGRRVMSTAVSQGNGLINSEFVINRFKPSDAGNYMCLFYNDKNGTAEANTSLCMCISNWVNFFVMPGCVVQQTENRHIWSFYYKYYYNVRFSETLGESLICTKFGLLCYKKVIVMYP